MLLTLLIVLASDALLFVPMVRLSGIVLLYALLARKASYRWFDAFCLLIPVYGLLWQFRIAYRIAYQPHQDWPPRPDEIHPRPTTYEAADHTAAWWPGYAPSPTGLPQSG